MYSLYELFQDSLVVGVHIIFFVPIGWTLCTVWNVNRQAGLKFGNGYIGLELDVSLAQLSPSLFWFFDDPPPPPPIWTVSQVSLLFSLESFPLSSDCFVLDFVLSLVLSSVYLVFKFVFCLSLSSFENWPFFSRRIRGGWGKYKMKNVPFPPQ